MLLGCDGVLLLCVCSVVCGVWFVVDLFCVVSVARCVCRLVVALCYVVIRCGVLCCCVCCVLVCADVCGLVRCWVVRCLLCGVGDLICFSALF